MLGWHKNFHVFPIIKFSFFLFLFLFLTKWRWTCEVSLMKLVRLTSPYFHNCQHHLASYQIINKAHITLQKVFFHVLFFFSITTTSIYFLLFSYLNSVISQRKEIRHFFLHSFCPWLRFGQLCVAPHVRRISTGLRRGFAVALDVRPKVPVAAVVIQGAQ